MDGINAHAPSCSILFVDDNSTDGTRNEIQNFIDLNPNRVFLETRAGKLGLGTAYIHGMKWALNRGFDRVIQMDADLSHDPKYLPQMLKSLDHSPLVIGSRYVRGGGTKNWSAPRKFISRFGSFYARIILQLPINDFTGGFNGWQTATLRSLPLDNVKSNGYVFQIEMKARAVRSGFSFCEFPIIFVDRQVGQSKMTSGIIYEAMWRVLTLRASLAEAQQKRITVPRAGQ
ncbi:MAG: polyprenol monophosphomannose synthase [Proteobacteria bacterium]|nr:polyprenol monophosphomannose synthase [Pseudomonadota bacterium]